MKIAIIAPILSATPPRATGPQEQMASLLTEALVARGHDVTLYATGDSRTSGRLKYLRERAIGAVLPAEQANPELLYNHALMEHTFWAMADAARSGVNVVHSHRPVALLCQRGLGLPQVNTVHHGFERNLEAVKLHTPYFDFFDQFPGVELVAVSEAQRQAYPSPERLRVIHHALDYGKFQVGPASGRDYLLCLGSIVPVKGVHIAVQVARAAGVRLKIAGALHDLHGNRSYYRTSLQPFVDGDHVEYVGEASAESRVALYAGARALLCPLLWDEPFGLTMLEAMACGTPVIAFRRGAAPEIVEEGVTGHLCDDVATMLARVREPAAFDPATIRARAETRFSLDLMTSRYEAAYRTAVSALDAP